MKKRQSKYPFAKNSSWFKGAVKTEFVGEDEQRGRGTANHWFRFPRRYTLINPMYGTETGRGWIWTWFGVTYFRDYEDQAACDGYSSLACIGRHSIQTFERLTGPFLREIGGEADDT